MDFSLTDSQRLAAKQAAALGASIDAGALATEAGLRAAWRRCGDLGLLGLPFPPEHGGCGPDLIGFVACMEGLGFGLNDNGFPFAVSAQVLSVQAPIAVFGTGAQKQAYLEPLNRGLIIGAHAMSEPKSGSDAFSLDTRARLDGDCYVLDGSKIFVTNAPVADLFIVFATVSKEDGFMGVTGFIVERDTVGLSVSDNWSKIGLHNAPMGQVFLDGCRVPVSNRLGREGAGFRIFNESMDWERGLILAQYLGAMRRQIDECIQRLGRGHGDGFGRSRARVAIGRMRSRLEASRVLVYRVAWAKQSGKSTAKDAAMAKLLVSRCWLQNCEDAVLILPGEARVGAERDLVDALGPMSYSGTSEIQQNLIAQAL